MEKEYITKARKEICEACSTADECDKKADTIIECINDAI